MQCSQKIVKKTVRMPMTCFVKEEGFPVARFLQIFCLAITMTIGANECSGMEFFRSTFMLDPHLRLAIEHGTRVLRKWAQECSNNQPREFTKVGTLDVALLFKL